MTETQTTAQSARRPNSRCCDHAAHPQRSYAEAVAAAADFAALAHPVRLQLLDVLARNGGRVCVCDLEAAVPVKQPTVSHHLRLLREAGLVDVEKAGIWAHYRVNAAALAALHARIAATLGSAAAALDSMAATPAPRSDPATIPRAGGSCCPSPSDRTTLPPPPTSYKESRP